MYGSRYPITVNYDVPLEVSLLFGVNRDNYHITNVLDLKRAAGCKIPETHVVDNCHDLTNLYNSFRKASSEKNSNGKHIVTEGYVMYVQCKGESTWKLFKLKPNEIEKMHRSTGKIPTIALWTTAINSFETGEPTKENFIELLKEEYSDKQISGSADQISKTFDKALEHIQKLKKINDVWKLANEKGFDVTEDKTSTLRFVSQYFDKAEMRWVGSTILKQAGLLK